VVAHTVEESLPRDSIAPAVFVHCAEAAEDVDTPVSAPLPPFRQRDTICICICTGMVYVMSDE
jgi:hypothetical protein